MSERVLSVEGLKKHFPVIRGFTRETVGHVRAVDGVSFGIDAASTLGLVGESGCGKTTVAKCVMRALTPSEGRILMRSGGQMVDISRMDERTLRPHRRAFQMVFQDPYRSINPRVLVRGVVGESLDAFGYAKRDIPARVDELLAQVGLSPDMALRYPHAFSGGQRQRIAIARALAISPSLMVLDEAVSALDVSVQAQILNLLKDLQKQLGLAYLFISHDLSVIRYMSDHIAVMYMGRIVEYGEADRVFRHYCHPYTEILMAALPDADPESSWSADKVVGEIDLSAAQSKQEGCAFCARCPYAQPDCAKDEPAYRDISRAGEPPHFVACHHELHGDVAPS